MRRSLAVLGILAGLALLVLGGARFLVERLDGSDPWTASAVFGIVLVAAGAILAVGSGWALVRQRIAYQDAAGG